MASRRELIVQSARGALGALAWTASGRLPARAAAPAGSTDPRLAGVHPQLRAGAEAILGMDRPELSAATLAQARAGMAQWARPNRTDIPFERRVVPGLPGQPEVTLYVVNARPGTGRGAILHTHGGGYVMGTAAMSVRSMQDFAADLDCVIVTVEYRLAPEATWTGALADTYAALKWLHAHAAELGADPARIAVMGESAGGGHAALLALTARDRGEVPLVFQCLTYPMLDDRTGSTRAVPPHVGHIVWTPAANRYGWSAFLGMPAGGRTVPAAAVPARRTDLKGLPPAWIGVGGLDLFVGEDIAYAARLSEAGVPVALEVVPGAYHGFDGIGADTPVGKAFSAARLAALRAALAPA